MSKEKILTAFLESTDFSEFISNISEIWGSPIVIVDCAFRIAASFAPVDYGQSEYTRAVLHGELSFEAGAALSRAAQTAEKEYFTFETGSLKCLAYTLSDAGAVIGYMICIIKDGGEALLKNGELSFAAALVSKQFYFERRQIVKSTAEEILTELLDGEFSDEARFKLRAASTYLSSFTPERLAVIDISNYSGSTEADGFLRKTLENEFHASHPFIYKNKIVMFIHRDHDISRLAEIAKGENLKIAVSDVFGGIFAVKSAFDFALETLDYLTLCGKNGFCEDSEKYAVIITLKKLAGKKELIESDILSLAKYDKENSGALCETLYTYLCCHHSLKEACNRLFTHRNTVLYRINKIKEDFNIDTENPKKHFSYLISLAIILAENKKDKFFI